MTHTVYSVAKQHLVDMEKQKHGFGSRVSETQSGLKASLFRVYDPTLLFWHSLSVPTTLFPAQQTAVLSKRRSDQLITMPPALQHTVKGQFTWWTPWSI